MSFSLKKCSESRIEGDGKGKRDATLPVARRYRRPTFQPIWSPTITTAEGVLDCFLKARPRIRAPAHIRPINGTHTLVINSLIQRKGAKAALVTTGGAFATSWKIRARGKPARSLRSALFRRDEPADFPAELRFEVSERNRQQGRESVTTLDLPAPRAAGRQGLLRTSAIEAVAIFFMNSYANSGARGGRPADLFALPSCRGSTSTSLRLN